MRILDADKQVPLYGVQLYLTAKEASNVSEALQRLLKNPEALDHEHVFADDMAREISVSLVTPMKLANLNGYTQAEQQMFNEK